MLDTKKIINLQTLENDLSQFVAEAETKIMIIPKITTKIMQNFHLATKTELSDPTATEIELESGTPIEVPLWMALTLKKTHTNFLQIQIPFWMNLESLKFSLEEEKKNKLEFREINPYFIEVSTLLLRYAADDIPLHKEIAAVLKNLINFRKKKILTILEHFMDVSYNLKMDHVTPIEMNLIREPTRIGFDYLAKIDAEPEDTNNDEENENNDENEEN